MLSTHLQVSEENRNQAWDEKFFKLLSEAQLSVLSEDPQQGPDGWPYLITETIDDSRTGGDGALAQVEIERVDSAQKIIHWLSTRGIGLVVNPRKLPYPDYVFSYGMIWSFRETGFFIQYLNIKKDAFGSNQEVDSKFEITSKNSLKVGPASEAYLPPYVRTVLKNFLLDQGVLSPKILMVAADGVNYDLCFSLESLGSPPESEHQGILEAISWFLPPHYSVAVVSDRGFPEFEPLS